MIPVADTVPARNPAVATSALVLANGIVFVFELMMPPHVRQEFVLLFGMVPARFTHPDWAYWVGFPIGDYWPFLTSQFIHGGWIHVIANMWSLWIFGDNVEDRMGPVRFSLFYLLCGLAAGVVHWFTNPDSTIPTVGASGAIAGVMGAYFFLFPRARLIILVPILFLPLFFEVPAVVYLAVWAATQLMSGTMALAVPGDVGGVAWLAHAGGFGAGIALHRLFLRGGHFRPPARDEYGVEGAWQRQGYWQETR